MPGRLTSRLYPRSSESAVLLPAAHTGTFPVAKRDRFPVVAVAVLVASLASFVGLFV